MDYDTSLHTPEEVQNLLKTALKNIEHAHLDEILAIEQALVAHNPTQEMANEKIETLRQELSHL